MNRFLATAGLMGAVAIGLGAFGAHALKPVLAVIPEANAWWNTATLYLLLHAIAVAAITSSPNPRTLSLAKVSWICGAFIFSSTLYAMSLGAPRWLGAVTPMGGSLMIMGWILLMWSARGKK